MKSFGLLRLRKCPLLTLFSFLLPLVTVGAKTQEEDSVIGWLVALTIIGGIVGIIILIGRREKRRRSDSMQDCVERLNAWGLESSFSERPDYRAEARIRTRWIKWGFRTRCEGIIDLAKGDIRWISFLHRPRQGKNSPPINNMVLGIPDPNVPIQHKQVRIRTIRKKSIPIVGKVNDVYWKGADNPAGLAQILTEDVDVKGLAMDMDLELKTYPGETFGWTLGVSKLISPTEGQWKSFQSVANIVLASSSVL